MAKDEAKGDAEDAKAKGDAGDAEANDAAEDGKTKDEGAEDAPWKPPVEPPENAAAKAEAPALKRAAWGAPIVKFEAAWTRLETRLITWVLVAQLLSMVAWVVLSGLSSPVQSGNASGLVLRAVIGAGALGAGAWLGTRKQGLMVRRLAAIGGIVVGAAVAPLWRQVGVDYFDNVRAWLQEGSTLTLMGGLRGVATRLTLWLALLGGSLATASGKHINIDVVFRFVPPRFRAPVALVNYAAAGLMCFAAVWGFFDHIAIESFGAKAEDSAGAKMSVTMERMGDHFFLARKQLGLDIRSLPHIAKGDRFDQWMSAKAWNEWVKDAGFDGRYPKEEVETILVPEDAPPHSPLVLAPDGEATRGVLVHDLSLVFPVGMLAIALRFLLRALLILSGHLDVDPNAAHKEEVGQHGPQAAEPEKGEA
jgi:TRAP-type C4-dicarboxylate transport system permease small subunit